ncbi:uncharacterized protein [Cicer arietinum]|uniref:Uncharacterized protein LOC105851647 n=1 Tax=Cicer arietinum TaxID=3827 RepID=A0A3Q7XLK2_CICAR|nr:uncharacterized protein LOC105851647 [Cicer arietinum]
MMAPVFSKKSWQCVWRVVQNDLIHAWGLDRQLGYCAQGDRMRNVGVVDSEYIVHLGNCWQNNQGFVCGGPCWKPRYDIKICRL